MSDLSDGRAIGIFDSGLGGLTVARAVSDAFPGETICYLGDTARVPYGTKSPETVRHYAREDIAFFIEKGAKVVIAACNTVSAAALPALEGRYAVPILGVVEKGVEAALDLEFRVRESGGVAAEPARIGVIGTETTIHSLAYPKAIARRAPSIEVLQRACPLFVPLIEEGWIEHPVTDAVIREYLEPLRRAQIDTLILGCTHYPLIGPALARFFGPSVRIVDSARAMVRALRAAFADGTLAAAPGAPGQGDSHYYATDRYNRFRELVEAFMSGRSVRVELIAPEDLTAALARQGG